MRRVRFFGFAALVFVLSTAFISKIDLEKKSLLNDRVELKVPSAFTTMSDDILKMKYPSENRPKLVFTNETAGINVALSLSENPASQESITDFVDQFTTVFKSASSIDWKGEGLNTINDRQVGYIEFVSPAMDTEIYNLLFFTDLDGKLLICTFNCVKKSMSKWKPTAKEIMNSLRIK